MPSIKISELTEKTTMAGTEEVLINDSGTSKKFSTQRFLDIKTASETAQTAAELAETNAETAETNAETAETNASTSATSASSSATIATTQASNASTSATNAATSETNAATSATNAAASATSASGSASTATTQATTATTKASEASTSATNAATSETNASSSATSASGSATSAASSASTATTKASEASTSATNASNSATSATTAQSAAESARDSALAAFDSFDDRYLGQKASDPTLDNDGNTLVAGTLYFNTTDDAMMVYEGSAWVAAYASLSGALLQTNNLSDLNNAGTGRTNLGVAIGTDVQAHSAVLDGTTASYTTAEETKLAGIETNANNYSHPSGDGNLHVPATSTTNNGKVLTAGATAGSLSWTAISADPTMGGDLSGVASNAQIVPNAVTDTELNSAKLNGIEDGATADQSNAEIKTAYEANANTNEFSDAEKTKLAGVETSANNYSHPATHPASMLTGALPAIDGSALTGVQPFPSGTKMVFYQASAPTGWTQDTTQNNKALRVVSGTGGGNGGSWDLSSGSTSSSNGSHTHSFSDSSSTTSSAGSHTHTGPSHTHSGPSHTHSTPNHNHGHNLSAASHTLSASQMPSHSHSGVPRYSGRTYGGDNQGTVLMSNGYSTSNTGGSASHSHNMGGSISSGGGSNTGSASGTTGSGGTGSTSSNGSHTHTVAVSGNTGSGGSHTHTISAPKYIDVIVASKN